MWLKILRRILTVFGFVLLVGTAFIAGGLVARFNSPDTRPKEFSPATAENARRARALAEEALAARFAGDYGKALALFDEAASADPLLAGVDLQKGFTHLFAGRFAEAEAAAQASLARNEQESDAHALLVMCAAGRANAGESTDQAQVAVWADKARAADPLSSFVHFAQGEYARATGHPQDAVEHYRRALERVSPTDSSLVSTVKAGLSGLRLREVSDPKPVMPALSDQNVPPEWLFFAAAQALLDGDAKSAKAFLVRAKGVLRPDVFAALLKDSFFQDHLPDANFSDPQSVDPP